MSSELNASWTDRGTGYNFFDGTNWGPFPVARLENSRGGWPSILKTGSGKEIVITHNTDNSHVNMTHRPTTGSGAWTEQNISSYDAVSGLYRDMIWNRTAVGGADNKSLHMIAKLKREEYIKIYTYLLKIRRFEERAAQLYGMGYIGGFCHLYIGQEAVVVGVLMTINKKEQFKRLLKRKKAVLRISKPAQFQADGIAPLENRFGFKCPQPVSQEFVD